MDATEYELRQLINELHERIQEIEEGFDERLRQYLVSRRLIEPSAEDE